MTEAEWEEIQIYLNYIAANYPRLSAERIAENLGLEAAQIESLLDDITWDKLPPARRVAGNTVKANVEDAKPACVILPFMKLTNND